MEVLQEEATCNSYSASKILSLSLLLEKLRPFRESGKTVATLNGSFDLMHAGHLYILEQAALQADILVVAMNSDHSIHLYKSPDRPIIPLRYRMEMMAAIGFVHWVTSFDEPDPLKVLGEIKPDVHVNGAEYGLECIERATVEENGGRLHIVPRIPGLATSEIIEKILNTCA